MEYLQESINKVKEIYAADQLSQGSQNVEPPSLPSNLLINSSRQ